MVSRLVNMRVGDAGAAIAASWVVPSEEPAPGPANSTRLAAIVDVVEPACCMLVDIVARRLYDGYDQNIALSIDGKKPNLDQVTEKLLRKFALSIGIPESFERIDRLMNLAGTVIVLLIEGRARLAFLREVRVQFNKEITNLTEASLTRAS